MKSLIIAEKPSVARDIARVMKCSKPGNGCLEGSQYIVTWGLGHLVELADPEEYNPSYKQWKMEDLPMIPDSFKLTVIPKTSKQYSAVKTQIHRKDVGEIIIATDAGREGELVARLILKKTGCHKPVKRLWISSVTDKAIREGFSHLKDGKEYDCLYDAAMCRAEADWLVGINATRALTCKYNAQLSCGRVQTPTLAMIAKREKAIQDFVPQSYYGLQAKSVSSGLVLTWQNPVSKSTRSFDRQQMELLLNSLSGKPAQVEDIRSTPKKTMPPLLYDLTELQRDANKRFNYSAKETLNIMQRLYENHKVLTYPRTDSRYLTLDIVPTLKERLMACGTGPYKQLAGRLIHQPLPKKPFYVDKSKVSDHHAIIPTEQFVQLDHMTVDERRIYDLVVRRFLAVMYPSCQYEQTSITVKIQNEIFIARGNVIKNPGWKEAYQTLAASDPDSDLESSDEEDLFCSRQIPSLKKGEVLPKLTLSLTQGKTKAPAPFNEATLLSAMENPAAYMESGNRQMAQTLGETGGLGTVATRADIIEKLFSSFLLEKRGKDLFLTPKAKQLLQLVPEDLKKPELTADWEMRLFKIAKGTLKRSTFMADIRNYSTDLTSQIKTGEGTFRHDNLTNSKCPVCGKRMLAVKGKNSEMLVCQDRECNHRETVCRTSNARCPVCHKKMQLYGKGDSQIFVCSCGHKEKLKAFQERRKKEGAGVSKRDVANYMNQQKKEAKEPLNNAFAQLLSGIQLEPHKES